jgi:putative ABC transport system permease protein
MISFVQTLRLALTALVRNRSRSLLTMLGVVIGVAAVIVTVAIGSGATSSVAAQINGLGSNLIVVIPGSVQTTGAKTGTGGASTLTAADGMAIATLPGVAAVSPVVSVRTQLVANGQNWQTTVSGVAPSYTTCATGRSRRVVLHPSGDRRHGEGRRARTNRRAAAVPQPIRSARRS